MSLTMTREPKTATELVASLPPEMKSDVFCELLRELIRYEGDTGIIPVSSYEGEFLGTVVPAAVERKRYEAFLAELPPEARAKMTRPLPSDFDPDNCLTNEQLEANRAGIRPQSHK